jgi:hypothetical protein
MSVEPLQMNNDEARDWRQRAEERGRALADAEKTCRAWMKTAQMAEDWADQLGRVRQWLQEQLLAQSKEVQDAHLQREQALAELAALREQCETAKKALVQKQAELYQLEQSRSYRIVRWMRRRLLPPQTLRGRLVAKSVRVTLRLLRRSA